jgi:hypothetical protein
MGFRWSWWLHGVVVLDVLGLWLSQFAFIAIARASGDNRNDP